MSNIANASVMKAGSVKLGGKVKLELNSDSSHKSPTASSHQCEPQARLTENNSECAMIEVTCSCGQRISIKCNYKTA